MHTPNSYTSSDPACRSWQFPITADTLPLTFCCQTRRTSRWIAMDWSDFQNCWMQRWYAKKFSRYSTRPFRRNGSELPCPSSARKRTGIWRSCFGCLALRTCLAAARQTWLEYQRTADYSFRTPFTRPQYRLVASRIACSLAALRWRIHVVIDSERVMGIHQHTMQIVSYFILKYVGLYKFSFLISENCFKFAKLV